METIPRIERVVSKGQTDWSYCRGVVEHACMQAIWICGVLLPLTGEPHKQITVVICNLALLGVCPCVIRAERKGEHLWLPAGGQSRLLKRQAQALGVMGNPSPDTSCRLLQSAYALTLRPSQIHSAYSWASLNLELTVWLLGNQSADNEGVNREVKGYVLHSPDPSPPKGDTCP